MMTAYNFSAGPAKLPEEVMLQAQNEFVDWNGQHSSVMEISHRSKAFLRVAEEAESDFRDLLTIPANYKVLFMHGGGRGQFAAVPLNLSAPEQCSTHIVTGSWSKGAVAESDKYNNAVVIAEATIKDGLKYVEPVKSDLQPDAAYCHFCPNETVDGIAFDWLPQVGSVPLVADMSSTILSQPLDIDKYGLIYAGAQKNIGPSGLSVVIVRDDLLGKAQAITPSFLDYSLQSQNDSMYNTPPTYSWYLAGLVFKWLKDKGGVNAIAAINDQKSALLYEAIDSSDFYNNPVHPDNRSKMNVPFTLANGELDSVFLEQAESAGLQALKGHRSVGGMRASIYNAMPLSGVQALVAFMKEFERKFG
ncbi:3-phosphoserine/phosphohydroxythreonine transaminase [Alteromonas sediminis]|uniref:Phosphoserine aminotransferase n=1 Tax=Alteromonas sediminis TaxID=2259342 RepID=A0A3N5Y1E8_9ALTE|nr:3-phosphoserine/phosphohydroxythreonine transaminase [Alteromonas sediminis]RPJ67452.1 3-phosphoserine/phosphohydroxythreonine transaminase [Alteromonas sediminis]